MFESKLPMNMGKLAYNNGDHLNTSAHRKDELHKEQESSCKWRELGDLLEQENLLGLGSKTQRPPSPMK